MNRETEFVVSVIIALIIVGGCVFLFLWVLNPSYPYEEYGVYYDFSEPNILRHYQGDEVTIYKKVEVRKL